MKGFRSGFTQKLKHVLSPAVNQFAPEQRNHKVLCGNNTSVGQSPDESTNAPGLGVQLNCPQQLDTAAALSSDVKEQIFFGSEKQSSLRLKGVTHMSSHKSSSLAACRARKEKKAHSSRKRSTQKMDNDAENVAHTIKLLNPDGTVQGIVQANTIPKWQQSPPKELLISSTCEQTVVSDALQAQHKKLKTNLRNKHEKAIAGNSIEFIYNKSNIPQKRSSASRAYMLDLAEQRFPSQNAANAKYRPPSSHPKRLPKLLQDCGVPNSYNTNNNSSGKNNTNKAEQMDVDEDHAYEYNGPMSATQWLVSSQGLFNNNPTVPKY